MNITPTPTHATDQAPVDLEAVLLKASVKQVKTLVISTAIIVASVCASYYGIQRKNDIQDLQLETLRLQVEQINISLHDHQQQINNKKDK